MILINNLKQHNHSFREQFQKKLETFLDNGSYVLGQEVKKFESGFSNYVGCKHTISVANGTDALEIAIKTLNLSSGSEIITAANAAMYSTLSILNSGFKPKFVDIEKESYYLDTSKILSSLSENTKAVIFTHLYGRACDLSNLKKELDKVGVFLIEDCAQSHGARFGNKKAGTFGHISTFSFYPTKNLGALGDGGAICTSDPTLFERASRLRQYGWETKYFIKEGIGRNSRLDEIQALFLNVKLPYLDEFNRKRLDIANRYINEIKNNRIVIREFAKDGSFVAHLFVIELMNGNDRSVLMSYLSDKKVASDVHYPLPDYKQNPIKNDFADVFLESTEEKCGKILTLPCYPELEDKNVSYIIESLNKW